MTKYKVTIKISTDADPSDILYAAIFCVQDLEEYLGLDSWVRVDEDEVVVEEEKE